MFGKNTDEVLTTVGIDTDEALAAVQTENWLNSDIRAMVAQAANSGRAIRALDFTHFRYRGIIEPEAAVLADVTDNTATSITKHLTEAGVAIPTQLHPISIIDRVVVALDDNPAISFVALASITKIDAERLRRLLGVNLVGLIHDPANDMYEHTAHTWYSDDQIFDAMRAAAAEHGDTNTIPVAVYRDQLKARRDAAKAAGEEIADGRPSVAGITRRFGSWNAALAAAGLTPGTSGRDNYERRFDDEGVTRAVAEFIIDHTGRTSAREYDQWAAKRTDVPRSIGIAARPRRWREVVADAFGLIHADPTLANRHRAAVKEAVAGTEALAA